MRFCTLAIAAALSAGFAPFKGAENPVVTPGRAPRMHRDVSWAAPQGALARLPSWRAMWDRDTDVPVRMWGPALAAPGTSTSAAAAEQFARQQLASHLSLLAPGAVLADFVVLANELDRAGLRTVAFAQRYQGIEVVGGAVAFTFSHDKLTMISSTALPNISARVPSTQLTPAAVATAARNWLLADGHRVDIKAHGTRVVMPIVHARGNRARVDIEYRVSERVEVAAAEGAGTWNVWIDASDASPVARATTTYFASGQVLYDTPDRYPGAGRSAKPAPRANHTINMMPITSTTDGMITWDTETDTAVAPGLSGPLVRVSNKAGTLAAASLTLAPGGSVTWSLATEEYGDAQLNAFVAASGAKEFTRTKLDPELTWLNSQIPVVVNEQETCNAFSTGNAIHFFKASTQCENTGRLADVVYHEFGHSLHAKSIIPGEGSWDGALSEGLADTFVQAITGDPGMGRGFFKTSAPLRNLDPAGREMRWPDDVTGQVHNDGEIIGGALWDLRTTLEAQLGVEAGYEAFLKIFYGVMRRSSDIPTTYAAALLTDDDDGDIANGTPHMCAINTAFGLHGLADPAVTLGLLPPLREGFKIGVTAKAPDINQECPAPSIVSGALIWKLQGSAESYESALVGADDAWSANIATQPDGTVVRFQVRLELSDGSKINYPQNPADPDYQFYVGNVETLWCADFEDGGADWVLSGPGAARVEWEVGAPLGQGGDPKAAYSGTNILGIDLGEDDGLYRNRTTQYAESPEIDLQGHTQVRLQYYRWLAVEDAVFDKATISANDQVVWTNFASASQNTDGVHHTDKEWRFHDVDVSAQASSGKLKIKFALQSDDGLALAGWNVDDVCLVMAGPPSTTCGNNNVDPGETCDDGNQADGDACAADCGLEVDTGCCSVGTHPAGPLALSLLTLGLVVRRRRRR